MKNEIPPQRMTLREFRFWLEGLLSGNDNPRDLPKRDQWQQIITRMDWIIDPNVKEPPKSAGTSGSITISPGNNSLYLGSDFARTTVPATHTHSVQSLNYGGINGSSS